MNKSLKIVNDPIYGFIRIPTDFVFQVIEHSYFQRLRRIRQLGMTHLVYPGANHTRFHHALGAMHLMMEAVDVLRSKGHQITPAEAEGAYLAILLHDIGHGPFSHALEDSIVTGIRHEEISEIFMDRLNHEYKGKLEVAIAIFRDLYPKKFLHQLVSSQLDMDRLDYLNRDSFFAGVSEGVISNDRIIKMLEVHDDQLCIEEKGIYSIEKFIVARRLMYWQVYLHKTVVSAECLLINILKKAKDLVRHGEQLQATPALSLFLHREYSKLDFIRDEKVLDFFAELDDSDVSAALKLWCRHPDPALSDLSKRMLNRKLFRIQLQREPFSPEYEKEMKDNLMNRFNLSERDLEYYFVKGTMVNNAYSSGEDRINILLKDGSVKDIAEAADSLNIKVLSEAVEKHYICSPK